MHFIHMQVWPKIYWAQKAIVITLPTVYSTCRVLLQLNSYSWMEPYSSCKDKQFAIIAREVMWYLWGLTSVSPKELKSPHRTCQRASESTRSRWQNRALAFRHNCIPIHHSFLTHTHFHMNSLTDFWQLFTL